MKLQHVLCRVCDVAAGKSPRELIDERVLTEARRLLAYSRKPVYEVAENLDFPNRRIL